MTKTNQPSTTSARLSSDSAVEQTVVQFAEQLGRLIGTAQARADGLLDRKALEGQLASIRDAAAELLEQVTGAPRPGARASNAAKPDVAKPDAAKPKAAQSNAAGKPSARRSSGRKGTPKAAARKAAARSRGPVDAPGKRHRKPAPTARGVKHSDERIAKLRTAAANRQRRGG